MRSNLARSSLQAKGDRRRQFLPEYYSASYKLPYQWTKQVASHWGGPRNGMIIHWPNGLDAGCELRHQFAHVIDVAPTVLEAAGISEPTTVHGINQQPMDGTCTGPDLIDDEQVKPHG